MSEENFEKIAESQEVEEGKGRPFVHGKLRIALVRFEGTLYALEDRCPHADASLAFGPVEEGCILCPWHYAQFDLKTGEALSGPATSGVRTYPVRESEGEIWIALPD